jgi:hypothetical protein
MTDLEFLEDALDADLTDRQKEIVQNMIDTGRKLTPKQRAFVTALVNGDRYEPEETYENARSAGKVPMGRPVEMPAVLRNLPLRPPGRR